MAGPSISIPNVDPKIAQKLQQVVTSIETATGKFNTGSSGIASTKTSVNGAVASIASNSSGQMVTALSTSLWPGTSKDGSKAHEALTSLIPHLTTLKGTINDHLPAIRTGLAAIQTAQADKSKSTNIDQNTATALQGQINGLITAMAAIATAAGPANTGIGGISIGGACSTGLQPGGKIPAYDENTTLMMKGKNPLSGAGKGLSNAGKGVGRRVSSAGKGVGRGIGKGVSGTKQWLDKPNLLARIIGPGARGFAKTLESLPGPLQKIVAGLVGGSANSFVSATTTGVLSGTTLSTFITSALGTVAGTTVFEALTTAGISGAASMTALSAIAGGIAVGSFTVYVIKPLVLDHIIHPSQPKTPPPAVVVKVNHQTGEKITTIVQANGSTETLDFKPDGTEIITEKDASGKISSVRTIPPK